MSRLQNWFEFEPGCLYQLHAKPFFCKTCNNDLVDVPKDSYLMFIEGISKTYVFIGTFLFQDKLVSIRVYDKNSILLNVTDFSKVIL